MDLSRHARVPFLLLALAFGACAGDVDVTIVTLEGDEKATKLIGVNADVFQTAGGAVPVKEIAEVRFNAPTVQEKPKITLRLRNGDNIVAAIVSGDDSKLVVKNDVLGELSLQNKFLDAIIFRVKDPVNPDIIDNFLREQPPKEDLLLLLKGDTVSGFIEKFSDKDLAFNAGGQSRTYAFDTIAGFRLAPLEAFKASPDLRGTIHLRDGSKINGKLLGLQKEKLNVEGVDGKPWAIAVDGIRSLLFTGGRMTYLSELAPATVEQKPYVEGGPFVYAWKRDVSLVGGRLSIGNKNYDRGISLHSYTRLVYDLGANYNKFLAQVGLDSAAPSRGECAWKVLLDGKEAAAGAARAGEAAQIVKLDVAGAKQLELICDYGADDDDAGDHLNFAGARLIKP